MINFSIFILEDYPRPKCFAMPIFDSCFLLNFLPKLPMNQSILNVNEGVRVVGNIK